jgi:hypothetical protein
MIYKMSKKSHLLSAELMFIYMEASKDRHNRFFWEKFMWESLFAWAGWKE